MGIDDVRKRTILSIIITFVCITLTNRLWFSINPLQISFNAEGAGNTKFEVFLNKKDNNDFKKVKYGVVEKNLDETDFVELFINRVHGAKRVKLSIQPPNPRKSLTISGFQLRYGKYKLDDLKAFSADGATLKIDGDKLIIYPQKDTFSIIYNNPVNIKSPTKFDIKVLIVIAVLSFLLAYKLTSYLADFKSLNNASRMDIIFLLIFFVILFIPMSNIDTKTEKSEKENRAFAKYKPFIKNNVINFNFGENFNNWFSDRFYLRNHTIDFNTQLKTLLNTNYKDNTFLLGQENWLFLTSNKSERNYLNLEKFSEEELQKAVDYIASIDRYCKKHNKKFVFVICPDKNKIYGEYYPNYYIKHIPDSKSRANQLIEALKKNNVDVVYFYDVLVKNKSTDTTKLLYWKDDTHWSKYGAYIAYLELAKHLGIKPATVVLKDKEKHIGDLSSKSYFKYNDSQEYINPEVRNKNAQCTQILNKKHNTLKQRGDINCNNKNKINQKILFYRDSFSINLIPFISENYNNSQFYWTTKVDADEINKADIIIFERVERFLYDLPNETPIKE